MDGWLALKLFRPLESVWDAEGPHMGLQIDIALMAAVPWDSSTEACWLRCLHWDIKTALHVAR